MNSDDKPKSKALTNPLAYVVAGFLGTLAIAGLGCGVHLTALIIRLPRQDATLLAVYVGLVGQAYTAGAAATAALSVLLSNVNKQRGQAAEVGADDDTQNNPIDVQIKNPATQPIPTQETPSGSVVLIPDQKAALSTDGVKIPDVPPQSDPKGE